MITYEERDNKISLRCDEERELKPFLEVMSEKQVKKENRFKLYWYKAIIK